MSTRVCSFSGDARISRVASIPSIIGHPHVHQDHVRAGRSGDLDRLDAVGGLAEHGEVRRGVDEHPETGPHERLVVDDDDPDHAAATALEREAGEDPEATLAGGARP